MDKRKEDPRFKGDIAEKLFELECLRKNINVYAPVNSNGRVDYIIEDSTGYKRVQIKYVSEADGKICCSLNKGQNGRSKTLVYTPGEVDLFLVYCPDTNEWYDIPICEINRVLVLRVDQPKNNQSKNVKFAKDYIWKQPSNH